MMAKIIEVRFPRRSHASDSHEALVRLDDGRVFAVIVNEEGPFPAAEEDLETFCAGNLTMPRARHPSVF